MADEQPTVSSGQQTEADAQSTPPSSEPVEETPSTSWWSRMWRRGGTEVSDTEQETARAEQASPVLQLTQEELDRRVQAETDRRETKRAKEAQEAQRRKLRDEDPWQYAENERKAEQATVAGEQVNSLLAQIGAAHDQHTIDPLITALSEGERKRILALEGAGQGLDGRKLIVTETLKALEKHWKAEGAKEAELKLRGNAAFRKQLLAESRSGLSEPEFLPSGNGSEGGGLTVSNLLRNQLNGRR